MRILQIKTLEAGQRLDKFLLKYMNTAGKSFIYKMLRKKNITLNGKKCSGGEKLSEGDEIRLFMSDETIEKFSQRTYTKVSPVELDIIYEDSHIIIINKPAGILSQKASSHDESLVEYIISYLVSSGQMTEESLKTFRPSVCNRLDRNTSGIITAGKSMSGLKLLSEILKNRTLHKYYLCVVAGIIEDKKEIEGYLLKNEKTNQVCILKEKKEDALPIKTEYDPVGHNERFTLLKVTLHTGRSHQIRAHLASVGHPVLGDSKYGNSELNREMKSQYGISSQLLHSWKLVMPEITGELAYLSQMTFSAVPPEKFCNLCRKENLGEALS